MKLNIQIGDTVYVFRWNKAQKQETTGVVEAIKSKNSRRRMVLVNGDWYITRNDVINGIEVVERADQVEREG